MPWYLFFIVLFNATFSCHCSFTLGFGAVGAFGSAMYAGMGRLLCNYQECCTPFDHKTQSSSSWLRWDMNKLRSDFRKQVHGQHLVMDLVIKALDAHVLDNDPRKALVLSFHGQTGSGKNHVSNIIAEALYKNGMKSSYVHLFSSTVHFPHDHYYDIYKLQIQDWIRGNVSQCEHSLFIFDEIDKMPLGVIDSIKPFIDYHPYIFGLNFRKSIFLFLSNTGSREISSVALERWNDGKDRKTITLTDIENLIMMGAFNEKGGLHKSALITHSLVDHYVPFLPLERSHIESCIIDELHRKKMEPTADLIKAVADSLTYYPAESKVFSTTGCKRVSQKTGYYRSEKAYDDFFS